MRNVSSKRCRENQNTHFMLSNVFFSKIVPLMGQCRKILLSQRSQMAIWRRVACRKSKVTRAQAHTNIRASTPMHTHACIHRARTHKTYVTELQFLHGKSGFVKVSLLRFTYIACLFRKCVRLCMPSLDMKVHFGILVQGYYKRNRHFQRYVISKSSA
jgi:hypothetical protein